MRLSSYLLSAQAILQQYKGDVPFAAWLKNYFREQKKFGSRDRRMITDLCYCFFRTGQAFTERSFEDRLLIGQFLCHEHSPFVQELRPEWLQQSGFLLNEKFVFLDASQQERIFPFGDLVSDQIDHTAFQLSFLLQPDLFLRIRPGKEKAVLQKLRAANVAFLQEGASVRLPNSTKIDDILLLDEEAVIQDISSQRVLDLYTKHQTPNRKLRTEVWDCCAASGGKSILFYDAYPQAKLTVSDVRQSILINLRNRFKRAGISTYHSFVADVASPEFVVPQTFDVVLCDAPCSGSGTWARTPEQLQFFPLEKVEHYAALQKSIALNAAKNVKQNGFFLYITCSVFQKENEDVVQFLQQETALVLASQQYLTGYDKKGDTLFAALFTAS